jgi:hypothetical protein
VSEQNLDRAQVGACFQQVGGQLWRWRYVLAGGYALHGRTPRPNLDGAVPQHHSENILILFSHIGLSD